MSTKPALPFGRCIVITNKSSTHSRRGARLIKRLRTIFPEDRLEIVNSPPDLANNVEVVVELSRRLDQHSLLCVAGGDGTVSTVINILLTNPKISAQARRAAILPLWSGNANDLAYMANGSVYLARLERIITKGDAVPVHPLAVTMKRESKSTTRLAACYVSFGASAYAAHLMNLPDHRRKWLYRLSGARFLSEMTSVTKALLRAKTFVSEIDGQTTPLYDLMLINGSRIAKVNRVPISLVDDHFYEILLPKRYPLVFAYVSKILRGFTQRQVTRTERALTLREVAWSQLDGEVHRVASQTEITVRPHQQPFYLLSTKLNK